MKFSPDCDLDKELSTVFSDLYQKNIEHEFVEKKIIYKEILKQIASSKQKSVTFILPPIEEDLNQAPIYGHSSIRYAPTTLHQYLRDPRHPDN